MFLDRSSSARSSIASAALAFALCASLSAWGQGVKISEAWVRAPIAGQKTASGYVSLTSDRDAALVAAASPSAGRVELHTMSTEGGVMRMRAVPRIELPAGQTVTLAPGGVHLMMFDLKQPLKPGDKVPLALTVQAAGAASGTPGTTLEVQAEVRPLGPAPSRHHH